MIVPSKNRILTIIFSIILGFCILIFTASSIVIPITKASAHDYKKIHCEITSKENEGSNVYLYYSITNDTSTNVSSLDITTEVYFEGSLVGNLTNNFDNEIAKKASATFSARINFYED